MKALLGAACLGAALGAVWGVFLRVWMRLLVVEGEFTWSGTLAIVGCSALAGVGLALTAAARRSGRNGDWRLAGLLALPLVVFPQGIMFLLPALVLGGIVASGRPPRWVRIALTAVTLAPVLIVALVPESEPLAMPAPIIVVTLVTLMAALGLAAGDLFRTWPPRTEDDSASDASSEDVSVGELVGRSDHP